MAKKTITKEDIITVMTEGDLESRGGYPYDYMDYGGDIFIASLDSDGSTQLLYFTEDDMTEWVEEANEMWAEYPDYEMSSIIYETEPSQSKE